MSQRHEPDRRLLRLRHDKSKELDALLDEAESRGSCLAATTPSLRRALTTRLQRGLLVSPFPRLFARPQTWKDLTPTARHRHILAGVGQLHPSWTACGVSAAVAHGLQVPYRLLDGRIHVYLGKGNTRSTATVLFHGAPKDLSPTLADGIRATDIRRTALDCMRSADARAATAIADSSLRLAEMSKGELIEYVSINGRGLRGIAQAREIAAFADARSANGGESIARRVIHELGYAPPDLQARFDDPLEPGRCYYADFAWTLENGTLVIGELDGVEKYMDPAMSGGGGPVGAILRERRRESRLTITRAAIARFSFEEVLDIGWFDRMLATYGVPRVRVPLVAVPPPLAAGCRYPIPELELVPLSAYGID